ncbi:MAG: zinc-ribbon domain-containing protein [Rhodobacteraceae bacterium]|nr:zinc-ribbon domain-containing protein [Paracoccaceae bacterium]
MRLECPNCSAHYDVDERVIPVKGRDVQCSNCGKTWFQKHPSQLEEEASAAPEPPSRPERRPAPEPSEEPRRRPRPSREEAAENPLARAIREQAHTEPDEEPVEDEPRKVSLRREPVRSAADDDGDDERPAASALRRAMRSMPQEDDDMDEEEDTSSTDSLRAALRRQPEPEPEPEDDFDFEDDDADFEEAEDEMAPTSGSGSALRSALANVSEPEEDDDFDDEPQPESPKGDFLRRSVLAEPEEPEEDDDFGEPDFEDEEPEPESPLRRSLRASFASEEADDEPVGGALRRSLRSQPEPIEDDDDDDIFGDDDEVEEPAPRRGFSMRDPDPFEGEDEAPEPDRGIPPPPGMPSAADALAAAMSRSRFDEALSDEPDNVFGDEDDATMAEEAPAARERPRRPVNPDALNILREEVERERQAREEDVPEAKSGFGLRGRLGALRKDTSQDVGSDDGDEFVPEEIEADDDDLLSTRRRPGRKSNGLPNIDEINSTLSSKSDREKKAKVKKIKAAGSEKQGSPFRNGFYLVLVVAMLAVGVYAFAPEIVSLVPEAEEPLTIYVDMANDARDIIDELTLQAITMANELMAQYL